MCLSDQPALKVRLAASSKRDGNEWAWVVNVAPTAAAVWAERTCKVVSDAAQNVRAVYELVFIALERQISVLERGSHQPGGLTANHHFSVGARRWVPWSDGIVPSEQSPECLPEAVARCVISPACVASSDRGSLSTEQHRAGLVWNLDLPNPRVSRHRTETHLETHLAMLAPVSRSMHLKVTSPAVVRSEPLPAAPIESPLIPRNSMTIMTP